MNLGIKIDFGAHGKSLDHKRLNLRLAPMQSNRVRPDGIEYKV